MPLSAHPDVAPFVAPPPHELPLLHDRLLPLTSDLQPQGHMAPPPGPDPMEAQDQNQAPCKYDLLSSVPREYDL